MLGVRFWQLPGKAPVIPYVIFVTSLRKYQLLNQSAVDDDIERSILESSAMNRFNQIKRVATSCRTHNERGLGLSLTLPLLGLLLLIINHISVVTGDPWLIPSFLQLP